MNIDIAAFLLGGILLSVGILGGGFEIKELKVPKVGTRVRLLSAAAGLVFICVGMGSSGGENAQPRGNNPPQVSPTDTPVDFVLTDQLGQGQVSEQVTVLVDGRTVGDLTVNQDYPDSRMRVTVPNPGQHSYTAEATAVFNAEGNLIQYTGVGQGMIDVEPGKTYSLRGSISGNTWLVSIVEEQ
jgi:hypothetical protein